MSFPRRGELFGRAELPHPADLPCIYRLRTPPVQVASTIPSSAQVVTTVREEVRREMMQHEQQLSALARRTEEVQQEQQQQMEEVRTPNRVCGLGMISIAPT